MSKKQRGRWTDISPTVKVRVTKGEVHLLVAHGTPKRIGTRLDGWQIAIGGDCLWQAWLFVNSTYQQGFLLATEPSFQKAYDALQEVTKAKGAERVRLLTERSA